MTAPKESAEAVFERITRRRRLVDAGIEAGANAGIAAEVGGAIRPAADVVDPPPSAWAATEPAGAASTPGVGGKPLRVDEILSRGDVEHREIDPPRDTFPRSATMRLILNNPTLALGVGLPAAALLLKSHATRRALRLALEVGTRPGVQELIGLSAATTVRLMRARARDAHPAPPAGDAQKKAP